MCAGTYSGLVDVGAEDRLRALWVGALPSLASRVAASRGLSVLHLLTGGTTSAGVFAVQRGNHLAVLKLTQHLAKGRRHEAAMRAYAAADLAPEVLEADEGTVDGVGYHLMVLEFVPGGDSLRDAAAPADVIPVLGRLLAGLRDCSATPLAIALPSLAARVHVGHRRCHAVQPTPGGAPVPEGVRLATDLLGELNATTPADHWVHGDLVPGNVLTAGPGRMLAIDPWVCAGDPDYDVAKAALEFGGELAGRRRTGRPDA